MGIGIRRYYVDLCGYRNTWTYVGIGIVEPYETRK